MLFLHETHEVVGGHMEEFGAFMRDEWRPLVEAEGSARLLWCWELTHGTGASYQAVTVTGVRDWTSWGALATRMQEEPRWRDWRRRAGELRRDTVSKLLVPASWSPNATIDLSKPPVDEPALFLHDTGWPFPGRLDDYVAALGSVYLAQIQKTRMISLEACWVVAPGTGKHHEAILLQTPRGHPPPEDPRLAAVHRAARAGRAGRAARRLDGGRPQVPRPLGIEAAAYRVVVAALTARHPTRARRSPRLTTPGRPRCGRGHGTPPGTSA
jgi:hypothetical protein